MSNPTPNKSAGGDAQKPTERQTPQAEVGTTSGDYTKNGDTSRGIDTGAQEVGATGKRGQVAG